MNASRIVVAGVAVAWALSLAALGVVLRSEDKQVTSDDIAALNSRLHEIAADIDGLRAPTPRTIASSSATPDIESLMVTSKTRGLPMIISADSATVELCVRSAFVHGRGSADICRTVLTDTGGASASDQRSSDTLTCWTEAEPLRVLPDCWLKGP